MGTLPIKSMIMLRRLNFYYYLTNRNTKLMIFKFLQAQRRNRSPGDWIFQVEEDLKLLKIEEEWENLRNMKKETFTKTLKVKVRVFTFNEMMKTKSNSMKLKKTTYRSLKTQEYLVASEVSDETIIEVLKYRTHMLDFNENFKGEDETRIDPICKPHPDS